MTVYKQVNTLDVTDAAYIAGIVDGEGTITLSQRHRNENRQLVISISNNKKSLLEYILKVTGAGIITTKRTYAEHHIPNFTYKITNRQGLEFLKQITPFLRSYKKRRSLLVMEKYIQLTPRNGKYTHELKLQREEFIEEFFKINPKLKRT